MTDRLHQLEIENARLTRTVSLCRLVVADLKAAAVEDGVSARVGAAIATLHLLLDQAIHDVPDDPA